MELREQSKGDEGRLDRVTADKFVDTVISVIRRHVPNNCPNCNVHLEILPPVGEELSKLSRSMTPEPEANSDGKELDGKS